MHILHLFITFVILHFILRAIQDNNCNIIIKQAIFAPFNAPPFPFLHTIAFYLFINITIPSQVKNIYRI